MMDQAGKVLCAACAREALDVAAQRVRVKRAWGEDVDGRVVGGWLGRRRTAACVRRAAGRWSADLSGLGTRGLPGRRRSLSPRYGLLSASLSRMVACLRSTWPKVRTFRWPPARTFGWPLTA